MSQMIVMIMELKLRLWCCLEMEEEEFEAEFEEEETLLTLFIQESLYRRVFTGDFLLESFKMMMR